MTDSSFFSITGSEIAASCGVSFSGDVRGLSEGVAASAVSSPSLLIPSPVCRAVSRCARASSPDACICETIRRMLSFKRCVSFGSASFSASFP